jgi:hypothetical protein
LTVRADHAAPLGTKVIQFAANWIAPVTLVPTSALAA